MKNNLIILEADGWLGVFLNGELKYEGHDFEGDNNFVWDFCSDNNVEREYVANFWVEDEDDEYLNDNGCFPKHISDLKGNYVERFLENVK